MKKLSDFIKESESDEIVYSVYYDDGTLYSYYDTEKEAKSEADKLTKENPDFPAKVKQEKKSEFEN
jgi:hypothetical protein